MAGNYWIKLYIEILDDSKMAILPDRLWRRVVELFLLAGRYGENGILPDTNELAWSLRCTMEDLDLDLKQIEMTGIISRIDHGWMVTKFQQRQAKMAPADKMRKYRERKQHEQYTGDVTLSNASVTQITDNRLTDNRLTDNRLTETPRVGGGEIFKLYEQNFGQLSPMIAEQLQELEKDYPAEWIPEAFRLSLANNKRRLSYAVGILKRWKVDGYKADTRPTQSQDEGYVNVTQQRLAKQNT